MLQSVDPTNCHHPNQRKKILSDLRLFHQTAIPPSQLRREQNQSREKGEQLDNLVIWLSCTPSILNQRLSHRVESMVEAGMLNENAQFIQQYFNECDHSRGVWQAIGLKEFVPLFEEEDGTYNGRIDLSPQDTDVKDAIAKVVTDTEQYAKRQITWIRNRIESRVKHLIQLDTSQLDQWDQVVLRPAENSVNHLLQGTLPEIHINHDHWDEQSSSRNKKYECSVCKKTIIGEEQWQQHIHGRVHKRHIEGLKRREAKEKYFERL